MDPALPSEEAGIDERSRVVDHVLRYELYRHRDISERLSDLLGVRLDPNAFNRSTWDILYYLIQSYLQEFVPTVTDIYLSTDMSKGTAITGLAELERRGALRKVRDASDGRRRRVAVSDSVAALVEAFLSESETRFGLAPVDLATPGTVASGGTPEPLIHLLNRLSHELRTPLTAIVGFSEMIADETLGPVQPAGYAEYARDIRQAASRLLTSLNETVDTTLAEHGVAIPLGPLMTIDMEEVVDRACRAAAATAERRGVRLRRQWGPTKGRIRGDRERLEQAARKLIDATVAGAEAGQTIDVETAFDPGHGMTLRVISPQPPLTARAVRAEQPLGTPEHDDLIKGLPLIEAIAHAHGGALTSTTDGPGRHVLALRLPAGDA